jgi:hypothetical protein
MTRRLIAYLACVQLLVSAGCTTTCNLEKSDKDSETVSLIIMEW